MMNGSDLLMYSQMQQHHSALLREAAGLHRARAAVRARRSVVGASINERPLVASTAAGVLTPAAAFPAHPHRAPRPAAGAPQRPTAHRSARLRRLAARLGTSLVAVGRRLERVDGH